MISLGCFGFFVQGKKGDFIMSPEFKMIWITTMILIVAINLVKCGLKGHDAWHEYKYGNEDMALNAISGHACFESDREYPFESGHRTPLDEFYRRYNRRLKRSGKMTQKVADRIADDVASQVRSLGSVRKDRDDRMIF